MLKNKRETLKQKCKRLENDCEVYKRLYQNLSKVNDQLREIYYEQVDKNEKQRLRHAKDYNRLLENYKTLKAHYIELNKECKELQEENISLLIGQKKLLNEVQQLHDRVMEIVAEEMNEDE